MANGVRREAWWLGTPAAVRAELETDGVGVTGAEAQARLARFGPNRIDDAPLRSLLVQFLSRFKNPLVLILLAASAIASLTGDTASFVIIAAMVGISVTLDFVQEHRAGKAAESLRQSVSVRATVLRDGTRREIPVAGLVPGDVALLSAGDLVPADGLVQEARDFFVNQALLTGESFPVEKQSRAPPAGATELQEATNAVFMGTSVISGSARMLVLRTGKRTALGAIAASVLRQPPPTAFETGTRRFGLLILQLTLLLVLFTLLVNTLLGRPWLESFLFSVALAVGLTPELLPMIVSVTLARGALRLAEKRVIVKRLASIQNLGSMDVLCTDKTGTLTEAKMRLEQAVDGDGLASGRALWLATLNSSFETGLKNPLDAAILDRGGVDLRGWTKVDEVPFDYERRRVSILADDGRERLLVVKGAAEELVALCAFREARGAAQAPPLDEAGVAGLRERHQGFEAQGYRVLAVAWRRLPAGHPHVAAQDETGLTFSGFLVFLDPPKEGAAAALAALHASGVAIKVVTGDSERVTIHVCEALGLPVTGVVLGKELALLDDLALMARGETANLFCRVNPAQKERIIRALKRRGHVVGYLGDGINDAPPLHSADVGLSVDTAVDVAKESADIILLDRDLGVLHEGVLEGRRTFGNIMKYIMMATSSNFGNMFSMAGAALFLPFLPMLPTQILLNNMLYDLSEVPIPLDRVDAVELAAPRTLHPGFIRNFMLVIGPISSLFDFLTFYVMLAVLHADAALFQTGWFVESLCTQVLVIFVIRTRGNPLRSRPHRILAATSLGIAAVGALLPFTPLGARFGFVPLPLRYYGLLAAMLVAYLVLVEGVKQVFYRRLARSG